MRIKRVVLDAYGPFTGLQLDLSETGKLHIVYGPNEAGKSSLLRGIRAALFGFPPQCNDNFLHSYDDLRAGAILVLSDSTTCLSFTRRKGTRNTLRACPNGEVIPDTDLAKFLGGLSEPLFEALFGLDHRSLEEGGKEIVNGEGEVAKLLFEAGGFPRLADTLANLEKDAKEIFGGANAQKPLNVKLREIQKMRSEASKAAVRADDYGERKKLLTEEEAKMSELRNRKLAYAVELQKLSRIADNYSDLVELDTLLSDIAALGSVPELPAEFTERRIQAQESRRSAEEQITKRKRAIAMERETLAALPEEFPLLTSEPHLRSLLTGLGNYRTQIADRIKLAERSVTQREVAALKWSELMPERSLNDIETFIWPVAQIEEFRKLSEELATIEEAAKQAEEALRNAEEEEQQLQREIEQAPTAVDTDRLDAILATLEATSLERRARELEKEHTDAIAKRDRELKKLTWWNGTSQQLQDVVAPFGETIARYEGQLSALDSESRELRTKSLESTTEQTRLREQLAVLTIQGEVPTEQQLLVERERRDHGWQLIRRSAFGGELSISEAAIQYEPPKALDEAFEQHLRAADDVADRLRSDSKRAAEFAICNAARTRATEAEQRCTTRLTELSEERNRLLASWKSEWGGLGFDPRLPGEMRVWDISRRAVLEASAHVAAKDSDLVQQKNLMAAARKELSDELLRLGQQGAADSESLAAIALRAQAFAKRCKSEQEALRTKQLALARVQERLPVARKKVHEQAQVRTDWQRRWDNALKNADASDASIAQVKSCLSAMPAIREAWNGHKDAERRMSGLDTHIGGYSERVKKLVAEAAPELADLSPDIAIETLAARLEEQRTQATRRHKCTETLKSLSDELANYEDQLRTATGTLNNLCEIAHCVSEADLPQIEQRVQQLREYQTLQKQIESSLAKRNGGASTDQVRQESAQFLGDALSARRLSVQEQTRQADADLEQCFARVAELKAAIAADESNTRHLELAQDLQIRISEARALALRYARLRLQQIVLQQAAEAYRKQHEAPVLKRASGLFAKLTLDSFTGLTTDFIDDEKVLKAVRAETGKQIAMAGLSNGTADQLFLVLRLAAIEDYGRTAEPAPCIFDDILVNSDDERAAAALSVLAECSQHTQILLFTHHHHLLEIAEKQIKGKYVRHDLTSTTRAMTAANSGT